jgi:hypothetical protein
MNQTFYKLRHIPTGLFFKPNTNFYTTKNNLSKTGKIYSKKPSFEYVKYGVYNGEKYPTNDDHIASYGRDVCISYIPDDWEIVKYTVVEEILAT